MLLSVVIVITKQDRKQKINEITQQTGWKQGNSQEEEEDKGKLKG